VFEGPRRESAPARQHARYDDDPDGILKVEEFTKLVQGLARGLSASDLEGGQTLEEQIPAASQDFELNPDVFAVAFILFNNATGGMYSSSPLRSPDMWLVIIYLLFIWSSQIFVLVLVMFVWPPAIDENTVFLDCTAISTLPGDMTAAECGELDVAFVLPAGADGVSHIFREFSTNVYFYEQIFVGDMLHHLLKLVCLLWVTTQIFFKDVVNVASLFKFRDFNRRVDGGVNEA